MADLLYRIRALEGKREKERREALLGLLQQEGYDYSAEEYKLSGREGINIILSFGEGEKEILATAHYDCAPGSPGANDNASGVSVLLELAGRLRGYKPKNKIKIVFFDDEEPEGLTWNVGSSAYIKAHGIKNLLGVYNLELVGNGDVIAIWPITKEVEGSPALENLRQVLKEGGYLYGEVGKLPLFGSDHKPFRKAGFKGAFTLTLVPSIEREEIRRFATSYISGIKFVLALFSPQLRKRFKIPLFFQRYHSPEDKSQYLKEESLKLMSEVLYKVVLNLDQNSVIKT